MSRPPNRHQTALVTSGTARGQFLGHAAADREAGIPFDLRDTLAAHDVCDEHLWAASEVAIWAIGAPAQQRRALVCLVVALLETLEAGGTYLPLAISVDGVDGGDGEPLVQMLRRLGVGETDQRTASSLAAALVGRGGDPALTALVGGPGSRRPFIVSDGRLYTERHWVQEERLVAALRTRLAAQVDTFGSDSEIERAIAASDPRPAGPRLSEEQRTAIRAALTNPLTIITGGPGTGKTSTMVGLLHALARLGVASDAIALAAPTGRAAQRMREAVEATAATTAITKRSPESEANRSALPHGATTLHRLLGIQAGRWRVLEADLPEYYADWQLPHRVVVVDEASMIDLDLMEKLVAATALDTRLVLLGDADQLPSVRVGAVFRDLVMAAPLVTCRLTRSHRMNPRDPAGADILRVASAVNAGPPLPLGPPCEHPTELTFRGFEQLDAGHLDAFLDRWHGEILSAESSFPLAWDHVQIVDASHRIAGNQALATLMRTMAASRILCVTREAGRTTSARALNLLMHGRARAAAVTRGAADPAAVSPFLPGEPVIVQRNDHARGLANGDVGVVVRLRSARGDGLGVAFAEGSSFMVHALEDIVHLLALAFALTIHKAQGSEFERVALMLPENDVPILSREIIYTALTRARTSVVVIGNPSFLDRAAARPLARTSGIKAKLAPPV